jgi:transcriptional regulator with XRE-family HTH domain
MTTVDVPAAARRTELAAFLRTRRERVQPEDVGLPPGSRRRTSGLRREEVAQLAGVGVTWYTWLEQGRPIHASTQVLDAVARTLRLDPVERAHLFRLAEVPEAASLNSCDDCPLPSEVQQVMDAISLLPACVVTGMFDVLAWNSGYAALFPDITTAVPADRNTLVYCLNQRVCCAPVENREEHVASMVAQLRAGYGKHVGDPAWTHFIRRLEAEYPEFSIAWAAHDVKLPASHLKQFRHPRYGTLSFTSTSFGVQALPGTRMVVYAPQDEVTQLALEGLARGEGLEDRFPCWARHLEARHLERDVPVLLGR